VLISARTHYVTRWVLPGYCVPGEGGRGGGHNSCAVSNWLASVEQMPRVVRRVRRGGAQQLCSGRLGSKADVIDGVCIPACACHVRRDKM
jgi:hypothetical protein